MARGERKRAVAPVPSRVPTPPSAPARRLNAGSAAPLKETFAAASDGVVTARLALLYPLRVFGAKATAMSQLAPGCKAAPHPFDVITKSAALGPSNAATVAVVSRVSLCSMNVCGALTAP